MTSRFDELSDLLTVPQLAAFLGVSRSFAYEQVAIWEATGGERGIPAMRIGNCWRVPTAALARWMNEHLPDGWTAIT